MLTVFSTLKPLQRHIEVDRFRFGELMRMAMVFGLVFGVLEAVGRVILFAMDPLGLAFGRSGASVDALWIAPVVDVVLFWVIALVLWPLLRFARSVPAPATVAGVYCLLTVLGLLLMIGRFDKWACLLLALGVALATARWAHHRAASLRQAFRRAFPLTVGGYLILATVVIAGDRIREWRAMQTLPPAAGHTNVLLIVADTLRADHLSAYGYARLTTPNLDKLAEEGMLFTRVVAPSSWTLPSHASMFTGLDADRHGAFLAPLQPAAVTLAETFRDHGYATAGFVANTLYCHRGTGLAQGFIHYEDFYGNLQDAVFRTVFGRRISGRVAEWALDYRKFNKKNAGEIRGDFQQWLDANPGRHFFAFLNFMDLHADYWPPEGYAARLTGVAGRSVRRQPIVQDTYTPGSASREAQQLEIDAYDASLAYLDEELGRLFAELRRRGLLDSTLIIFTSDHGEALFERDMFGHGQSLYREAVHVPLILRLPGQIPAGRRDDRLAGLADIPATALALTQLAHGLPGQNLLAPAATQGVIFSRLDRNAWGRPHWANHNGALQSLVSARWHFIRHEDGRVELYDWQADPAEHHNLANTPGGIVIAAALNEQLQRRAGARPAAEQAASH